MLTQRLLVIRGIRATLFLVALTFIGYAQAQTNASRKQELSQIPVNTWVKLSPLASTPPSPRLGYEGACAWDSRRQVMIRYGGHNQGGGGEQNSEVWTFEPGSARWTLHEANTSPPGICCGQQNIYDPVSGRYIRFPAFSASHGWQWRREVFLNDASVWTYDLDTNTWRNLRPVPTISPRPLRCASWDAEHQVIVEFGGEGSSEGTSVYDPWTNQWTQMQPAKEPEYRSGGNLAYAAHQHLHVMFGSQFNNDKHTWGYDLPANTWRDLQPPEMPHTDKNDAVLTYDSSARKIVAMIKITTGVEEQAKHELQTWTYDVETNRWAKQNPEREPDPTSNRARQLMFAPELGVALLENRPSNSSGLAEQQVWAYRLPPRAADEAPAAPHDLAVVTSERQATLSWKAPPGTESVTVERGTGDQPWLVAWKKVATVKGTTFEDRDLQPRTTYFYRVRSIGAAGRESAASFTVRTQPALVDDVTVSVHAANRVEIAWTALPAADVVGYTIERVPVEVLSDDQLNPLKRQTPPLAEVSVGGIRRIGTFQPLTDLPVKERKFVDGMLNLNQPAAVEGTPTYERKFYDEQLDAAGKPYRFAVYAYRVRGINALGVRGGASAATLTIPSAPQFLFAKEEGTTCHLKWKANAESALRGYRVYRMDGRYDKDAITRLTPEAIAETTSSDENAGKPARRYYVIAVDALGQEGFPSSPVWFNREWAPFYVPFVGEWHQ